MKLSEMLTYTASEFLDDRSVLVDGDPDSLWSDAYLIRQFNEGQKRIARRAWCIIEYGVAPAGIVVLQTGKVLYPLHPSILHVFDATPSTQTLPLGRGKDANLRDANLTTRDVYGEFGAYETGEYASLAGGTTNANAVVLAIATDAGTRTMRVSPAPLAAQNGIVVSLKIARMPINELSLDDTDAEPEVPSDWHMSICEYAAGKALTLPNVDGDQKPEGRRLLDEFETRIREAKQERLRMEQGGDRWAFSSTTAVLP